MLRLTILGSGTCVPYRRRGPAGYVVEGAGQTVLVDSGSGTLDRMLRAGVDYRRLSALAYTHTHPDHVADLAPLLFALNYTPGYAREGVLPAFGPSGFGDFVARLEALHPGIRPRGYRLEISEMDDEERSVGGLSLASRRVDHAGLPAVAYRFSAGGSSLVLSGDTTLCRGIVEISRSADVLVIEASSPFVDADPGPHLDAAQAGRIAAEAGARKVVLTHQYPVCDEHDMPALAGEHYDGEVLVAEDLMVLEIP